MLNIIKKKIRSFIGLTEIYKNQISERKKLNDLIALSMLHELLEDESYLPITSFSMRPIGIISILNDLELSSYKNILEFGSGSSTILVGRFLRKNNKSISITSIEENLDFYSKINERIQIEQLEHFVNVIHIPIKVSNDGDSWYDHRVLDNKVDIEKFDFLIVDGPKASHNKNVRRGSVHFIMKHLDNFKTIYVDDIHRIAEMTLIYELEQKSRLRFNIIDDAVARYSRNDYSIAPIWS